MALKIDQILRNETFEMLDNPPFLKIKEPILAGNALEEILANKDLSLITQQESEEKITKLIQSWCEVGLHKTKMHLSVISVEIGLHTKDVCSIKYLNDLIDSLNFKKGVYKKNPVRIFKEDERFVNLEGGDIFVNDSIDTKQISKYFGSEIHLPGKIEHKTKISIYPEVNIARKNLETFGFFLTDYVFDKETKKYLTLDEQDEILKQNVEDVPKKSYYSKIKELFFREAI